MAENNWLETAERERQRREEATKIALRLKEARESAVVSQLQPFLALCARVNALWPGSLSLNHLAVDGVLDTRRAEAFNVYSDYDIRIGHKRGLRVELDEQTDRVFVTAIVSGVSCPPNAGPSWVGQTYKHSLSPLHDESRRHACTLDDLRAWRESEILKTIDWMLLKTDSVDACLPGTPVATKFEERSRAVKESLRTICRIWIRIGEVRGKRFQLLVNGEVKDTEEPSWTWVRDTTQRWTYVTSSILGCFLVGGTHPIQVRGDNDVVSFTVTAELGKVMDYELGRSFFGRLTCKHVSTTKF